MDYKDIFENKAIIYNLYRPTYAEGLIQYLIENSIIHPQSIVADIGCGTGILAKQLCNHVSLVYGVEPNLKMLNTAVSSISPSKKFTPVNGSAERTTLSSSSIDFISAGQAFHWFDPILFRKEAKRIIKDNGQIMLVWNRKQDCELEQERLRIVNKYRTIKDVYDCSWEKRIEGIDNFFNSHYTKLEYDNDLMNSKEEFLMRTLSASHALETTDSSINTYLNDWEEYFERFCSNGTITIPNKTIAYIGNVE